MTGMAIERAFRKLTPATQAELRRIAEAMGRAGMTRIEAAATVGVNRRFVRRARAQRGEIHWADATGLSSRANFGRSFAPRGHTPVIRRPGKRCSQSVISSLTNQGKLRFMIYEGALKAPIFLNFLQRLIREATRKLFVIVDNLPVHRAHRVTAWVQDHADRIELFYLPSYAPEHNPDEFLNNDLKQAMARRRTPRDKVALKSGLTSYMRSLQRCPAKVRAFFQAPSVRYAA